jgi:hypothetical protein
MSQPAGRPTIYTQAIDDEICEKIAQGMSLREICKADGMPSRDSIYAWKSSNKGFSDHYNQAVEDRAELLAGEIVEIADDKTGDPARDRLRLDARKWIACKLFPRKYGDRVANDVNLTGSIIIQASPLDEKL